MKYKFTRYFCWPDAWTQFRKLFLIINDYYLRLTLIHVV
jgi:hypothetical protein